MMPNVVRGIMSLLRSHNNSFSYANNDVATIAIATIWQTVNNVVTTISGALAMLNAGMTIRPSGAQCGANRDCRALATCGSITVLVVINTAVTRRDIVLFAARHIFSRYHYDR